MEKLIYYQAEDLIFQAYFNDKIEPMDSQFCFCGTIAPDIQWRVQSKGTYPYTRQDYYDMETALFKGRLACKVWESHTPQEYEEALFKGMRLALEVLKQIHIERGEDVTIRPFIKRKPHCNKAPA